MHFSFVKQRYDNSQAKQLNEDDVDKIARDNMGFLWPRFWLGMSKEDVDRLSQDEFFEANVLSAKMRQDVEEMIAPAVTRGIAELFNSGKGGK